MLPIDKPTYEAELARAEARAAELPEGSRERMNLEQLAVALRADIARGYGVGIMRAGEAVAAGKGGC